MQSAGGVRPVPVLPDGVAPAHKGLPRTDDEEESRARPGLEIRHANRERVLLRQSAGRGADSQEGAARHAPVHQKVAVPGVAEEQHR